MTRPLLAVFGTALLPAVLIAQTGDTPEGITQTFAEHWADPTSSALLETLDPSGVLLAAEGREHRDLDRPKLLATVAQIREGAVGGGVRLLRVVDVAGSADRAFAELTWEAVMTGTSEAIEHTIYLGLVQRDNQWWINEIRLLS